MEVNSTTKFYELPRDIFVPLLSFLRTFDILSLESCSKRLNENCCDDMVWQQRCHLDLGFNESRSPPGEETTNANFRKLYAAWCKSFSFCRPPEIRFAVTWWRRMEMWLQTHAPPIYKTLGTPLSNANIDEYESTVRRLPRHLRLLYRFHNGQRIPINMKLNENIDIDTDMNQAEFMRSILWGMFGGSYHYSECLNMRFMPLNHVEMMENILIANNHNMQTIAIHPSYSNDIVEDNLENSAIKSFPNDVKIFASSWDYNRHCYLCDHDGNVYVTAGNTIYYFQKIYNIFLCYH